MKQTKASVDVLTPALKAFLYLGTALLAGAGLIKFWLFETLPRRVSHRLLYAASAGAALVILPSIAILLETPFSILGYADPEFMLEYALGSKEGRWVLARCLTVLVAAGLVASAKPNAVITTLFAGLTGLITTSFAFLGHAATRETLLPVVADAAHALAASFWFGGVLLLALLPLWNRPTPELQRVMKRFSLVAQGSVGLIVVTGVYASLLYLPSLTSLIFTDYGRLLGLKLLLFVAALGVAAVNHWRFLPRLLATGLGEGFRRAMFVELLFLVFVITFTGTLTLTPQP